MPIYLFCPICGKQIPSIDVDICPSCKNIVNDPHWFVPGEYKTKSIERYGHERQAFNIFMEEVVYPHPHYNPNKKPDGNEEQIIAERRKREEAEKFRKARIQAQTRYNEQKTGGARCPTCQSTNVKKISVGSKVAGAAMLGIFSKTARSQFQCLNCSYKW